MENTAPSSSGVTLIWQHSRELKYAQNMQIYKKRTRMRGKYSNSPVCNVLCEIEHVLFLDLPLGQPAEVLWGDVHVARGASQLATASSCKAMREHISIVYYGMYIFANGNKNV
jgi:hypothetical protein